MRKQAEAETFIVEPERYEFRALPMHHFELARRDFFKILGAGIAVFAVAKDALAGHEVFQRFYEVGSHTGLAELETLLRQGTPLGATPPSISPKPAASSSNSIPR